MTSPQFLQATRPTRTTTTACTACPWAAPGRGRRRRGASAVATLLRRAMLTLRDMQLPFTPNRLVNSRQRCTARRCSTEKQPLAVAATTRSPCPAPRATPSPSTTPPPPTLGRSTLIPLQGLLVNLQIHIARPQLPLRGCQPQHLLLHLLVINSLRQPPLFL